MIFVRISFFLFFIGTASGCLTAAFAFGENPLSDASLSEKGKETFKEYLQKETIITDAKYTTPVRCVFEKLIAETENPPAGTEWQVVVVRNTDPNTASFPGGKVIVRDSLVDAASSADNIAIAIAHSIQTIMLQHAKKEIIEEMIFKDMAKNSSDTQTKQMTARSIGRFKEADHTGILLAIKAGFNPLGADRFLASIWKDSNLSKQRLKALEDRMPEYIELYNNKKKTVTNSCRLPY